MYGERIWSTKVLISFWVVQMTLEFVTTLLLTVLIADELGSFKVMPPADVIFLICVILSLVLEPLTMLFLSYSMLKPWLFIAFQVFKAGFATVFSAYELWRFIERNTVPIFPLDNTLSAFLLVLLINISLGIAMALSFYASSIYGVVVSRRNRKLDNYVFVKERGRVGN